MFIATLQKVLPSAPRTNAKPGSIAEYDSREGQILLLPQPTWHEISTQGRPFGAAPAWQGKWPAWTRCVPAKPIV